MEQPKGLPSGKQSSGQDLADLMTYQLAELALDNGQKDEVIKEE